MIKGSQVADAAVDAIDKYKPAYKFGAKDPRRGAVDCSGLVTFVFRNNFGVLGFPDGAQGIFNYCNQCQVPVSSAKTTRGALLYVRSKAGRITHVAISMGDGRTVEARNTKKGCGIFKEEKTWWTDATLIPQVMYDGGSKI